MNEFTLSCPNCGYRKKLKIPFSLNSLIGQPQVCHSCKFRFKATERVVLTAQGAHPCLPAQSNPPVIQDAPSHAEATECRFHWYS